MTGEVTYSRTMHRLMSIMDEWNTDFLEKKTIAQYIDELKQVFLEEIGYVCVDKVELEAMKIRIRDLEKEIQDMMQPKPLTKEEKERILKSLEDDTE